MPPEQRRASIVEATIPLLQQQGVLISTRQIAEAAGVAEGTLFRVFDSLPDILEAAITEYLSVERLRPMLEAVNTGATLESTTRATIQMIIDDYADARRIFSAAHFHPHDAKSEELRSNIMERFRLIKNWMEEQLRPYADQLRISPELYTHFVTTVAQGYGNRLVDPVEISLDDLTQFALRGALKEAP